MPYPNRVFLNSLPKSGTHLLSEAVELFGYRDYSATRGQNRNTPANFDYREVKNTLMRKQESSGKEFDGAVCVGSLSPLYVRPATFREWLEDVEPGEYIVGHISYSPALVPVLKELNYRHVFIIRNPQAVIASLLSFILDPRGMPKRHFLEPDFRDMALEHRLNFILEGGYSPRAGVAVKSFAEVYRTMLTWRNEPDCLVLQFEELVGEQGSGSAEKQTIAVKKIAAHLGHPFDNRIAEGLKEIYNPSAPTFRIGQIDSWKRSMNPEAVNRVSEYCEPLCREAGYDI
ncbi:MAG: sulfotransferase domain-containing protein [Desulfobacterales bacterium]|nr:sulfotransferase domain-containing protein [Desulfobacterales bacterium]